MNLLILIIVIASILLTVLYILHEINLGKYKMKNNTSLVQKESEERFEKEYPNKSITDLKIEIEKISDMLLDNQESNRYTDKIKDKAKNDIRLDGFRNAIVDNVEIIKYKQGKLKAQVNYVLEKEEEEYTLLMYMNIVKKGRAFLTNYKTIKRSLAKNN